MNRKGSICFLTLPSAILLMILVPGLSVLITKQRRLVRVEAARRYRWEEFLIVLKPGDAGRIAFRPETRKIFEARLQARVIGPSQSVPKQLQFAMASTFTRRL